MKRHRSQFSPDASPDNGPILFDIDVLSWLKQREAKAPGIHISEPVEITCYSRDAERKVDFGSRMQLQKYCDPQLGSDLGENIHSFREKAEGDFGVEPVLGALQSAKFDLDKQADIITYRNNLNKIAGTPYNGRDAWELDTVMVGTSVFLDVRKLDEGPANPSHKRFMYFGYRFEALCTNTKDEPVDANSEFCSIIRLRLGNHRILFGGEIDCEWQSTDSRSALRNYVELKTMREPKNDRDLQNMYRHRFLKYWIQSYLAGVRTVVLGYRDDRGILRKVEHFATRSFPHLAKEHLTPARNHRGALGNAQEPWEPFVCLNFLDLVLARVRKTCAEHVRKTVRIRYQPQNKRVVAWIIADNDFADRMSRKLKVGTSE